MNELTSEIAQAEKDKKVNWDRLDTPIVHEGRSIILPADPGKMSIDKAIDALVRKKKDEDTIVNVFEIIDAHPLDGIVAFVKAMRNLYGWSSPVPTPGFFGPKPPTMLSVKTGPSDDDVMQCPWGAFKLPGVDNPINVDAAPDRGKLNFAIHGQVRKREKDILLKLANEARRIVRAESIYKGKPIRLGLDEGGGLDMHNPPEFLDVSDISESDVLFSDDIKHQIDVNVLVPMKQTAKCRKLKIPLKRGILLEGPYGTGKSLTARMAAKVAQDNGWTFVLLDKVQGLRTALEFANRYSPAVVFAEDIDRIATLRDENANDLINTIDGVVSKRAEIMTILTTNFAENLNPVILRPGRLDAVISLRAPDAKTVERLVRHYAGSLLTPTEDLTNSGLELAGQIPASIRECVERAKLGMIGRREQTLIDADIVVAAQTMKNHLALLNRKQNDETDAQKLANSLKKVIGNGTHDTLAAVAKQVDELHDKIM